MWFCPVTDWYNLAQAVAGAALIVIAIVYFQNYLGLEPCYLCITQRVFVIAVACDLRPCSAFTIRGKRGSELLCRAEHRHRGAGRLFLWQAAVAAEPA